MRYARLFVFLGVLTALFAGLVAVLWSAPGGSAANNITSPDTSGIVGLWSSLAMDGDGFEAPFPCLADPRRAGYKAFGLKRGSLLQVLGPAPIIRGIKAARKGHRIEKTVGDVFQMPGTFIIDSNGVVRYARYSRHVADHPSTADLIAALRSLAP